MKTLLWRWREREYRAASRRLRCRPCLSMPCLCAPRFVSPSLPSLPDLYNLALTCAADQKLVSEALLLARSRPLWREMANKRYGAGGCLSLLPARRAFAFKSRGDPGNRPRHCLTACRPWNTRDALAKMSGSGRKVNRFPDFLLPCHQARDCCAPRISSGLTHRPCASFSPWDSEPPARHRAGARPPAQCWSLPQATKPLDVVNETQLVTLQRDCAALAQTLGYESVTG